MVEYAVCQQLHLLRAGLATVDDKLITSAQAKKEALISPLLLQYPIAPIDVETIRGNQKPNQVISLVQL